MPVGSEVAPFISVLVHRPVQCLKSFTDWSGQGQSWVGFFLDFEFLKIYVSEENVSYEI